MTSPQLDFSVSEQVWPLDKPFRISRGTRTEARVILVNVTDGTHTGRGEAVPSRRYGETVASAMAQLDPIFANGASGINRQYLQKSLAPGAARNALDCALWDLEAKISGKRAWELGNIAIGNVAQTAFTISLDTPQTMAATAKAHPNAPILKLKLGGDELDLPRVDAVRQQLPSVRLLIDANESWSPAHYEKIVPRLLQLRVELIEQPFHAKEDVVLKTLDHPIPVCADESCHTTADLPRLIGLYDAVNVKLDKTGGLTEALLLCKAARQSDFKILIGCMVCTSLGIAPARLLASAADYLDLDGPLLLAGDRHHAICYHNGNMALPSRELWG